MDEIEGHEKGRKENRIGCVYRGDNPKASAEGLSKRNRKSLTIDLRILRLRIPRQIRHNNQQRRISNHNTIKLRHNIPRKRRRRSHNPQLIRRNTPIRRRRLAHNTQPRQRHHYRLQRKQMPDPRRVHQHERQRAYKCQEESYHTLRGDILVRWDAVRDAFPGREDASQAHGDELAFEIQLHSAPDNAKDSTQHDDEVLPVDAERDATHDRVADMVAGGGTAVKDEDESGKEVREDDDEDGVADGGAEGDE